MDAKGIKKLIVNAVFLQHQGRLFKKGMIVDREGTPEHFRIALETPGLVGEEGSGASIEILERENLTQVKKEAPKQETKAAPKEETKATPKEETKAAPKEETKAVPKKETKAAPKEETKAAPKKETKAKTEPVKK